MNKNYTRYSRGGILLDLENQKNHYKMILQPRKSMQINDQINKARVNLSLNQNNKYQKNVTKKRYEQNQRLYKALNFIRESKGIMQLMSERAIEEEKKNKKATLISQYRLFEKKKQLKEGNKRIVAKIGHIKPRIGNTMEWDQHYENFEKQKKQISRATQNVFDVKTIVSEKDSQLKQFLRQTLDFHRSRQSKSVRKNKTVERSRKTKHQSTNRDKSIETLNEEQIKIIKEEGKMNDIQTEQYQDQKFEKPQQIEKIENSKNEQQIKQ